MYVRETESPLVMLRLRQTNKCLHMNTPTKPAQSPLDRHPLPRTGLTRKQKAGILRILTRSARRFFCYGVCACLPTADTPRGGGVRKRPGVAMLQSRLCHSPLRIGAHTCAWRVFQAARPGTKCAVSHVRPAALTAGRHWPLLKVCNHLTFV